MNKKIGPYILLSILIIILVFIFGARYGQRVEKDNKKVDFLLSIPPTKPEAPTAEPLEFKTYKHQGCGLSFLYPSFFTVEKESSYGATIRKSAKLISFDCHKSASFEPTISPNYISFKKTNPKNYINIYFIIEKSLQPLVEKSLEFTK